MKMAERRNPKDLQALLKFCIEATKSEDAPNDPERTVEAMDEERRIWLEEALKGMSVDVFQELAKGIAILTDEERSGDEDRIEALHCIEDWIGDADMANNFVKLDGLTALRFCVSDANKSGDRVRAQSWHVIAEMAQNNPFCQQKLLDEGFLTSGLGQLDAAPVAVKVKALYAVSAMVREFKPGVQKLLDLDGIATLVKTLQMTSDEKLRTKCCFLLSSLHSVDGNVRKALKDMGTAQMLASVLMNEANRETDLSQEHLFRLLSLLLSGSGIDGAWNKTEFKAFLEGKIEFCDGKDEFQEIAFYAKEILKLLSSSSNSDVDR